MKTFQLISVMLFIVINSFAQQNSDVAVLHKGMRDKLPKEISIPNNCIITYLKFIDLNDDNMKDCIIEYWKKKQVRRDGDTISYRVYLQKTDSSFFLKKTLSNLKPLYFKSYSEDYFVQDSLLYELHANYSMGGGCFNVFFKRNKIEILFNTEAMYGIKLTFEWNQKKEDWILKQEQFYEGLKCIPNKFDPVKKIIEGTSIDNFNLLHYLE